MAALGKTEIRERLMNMPEWSLIGSAIYRKFTFKSFMPAIAFVNKIAQAAEQANHHPDITINYRRVTLAYCTHSEGGVTEKDFDGAQMADACARVAEPRLPEP